MSDQTIIIDIQRGEDYEIDLLYTDSNGDGVPLTSYTLSSTVKRTPTDTDVIFSPTITKADQDTFPGRYKFSITKEQIALIPFDKATDYRRVPKLLPFEIKWVTGGKTSKPVYGYLRVNP